MVEDETVKETDLYVGEITDDFGYSWKFVKPRATELKDHFTLSTMYQGQPIYGWVKKFPNWADRKKEVESYVRNHEARAGVEAIHTIWSMRTLISKYGPIATIRELKKRCDAGAIVACSMYLNFSQHLIEVALLYKDPAMQAPSLDFLEAAEGDRWIKRIEEIHAKYPDRKVPKNVIEDLKDEFRDDLERRVGRRVPRLPGDATKEDIMLSKRITEQLARGVFIKKPEEKPAVPPVVEPTLPIPVEKLPETRPELELMRKEIEERIREEKRRRARGGRIAGESGGVYQVAGKKKVEESAVMEPQITQETKDKILFISDMTDYITASDRERRKRAFDKLQASKFYKEWFDKFFYVKDRQQAKDHLMKFFDANEQGLDLLNYTFFGVISEYLLCCALERIKEPMDLQAREVSGREKEILKGGPVAGEPVGEYPVDERPLKERYKDFIKELNEVIDKLPPRTMGMERAGRYKKEYNRLKKKYNIPASIPVEVIKQVGELPGEPEKSREYQSGRVIAKGCFDYAVETGRSCPGSAPYVYFVEAVAGSIRNKEDISPGRINELKKLLRTDAGLGGEFNQGVYDFLIEQIQEYLKKWKGWKGPVVGENKPEYRAAKKISEMSKEERLKLARAIAATVAPTGEKLPTVEEIYPKVIEIEHPDIEYINLGDIDKMPLKKRIELARKIASGETRLIREGQDMYAGWTVDDFKFIISLTTNMEDLVELGKHIDKSKLHPGEKELLKKQVVQRGVEIKKGAPEIRKQIEEQQREIRAARMERLREDEVHEEADEPPEPRDYTQWTFSDFETFIPSLDSIDELEELYEYVGASDKVAEAEGDMLRDMITRRLEKLRGA